MPTMSETVLRHVGSFLGYKSRKVSRAGEPQYTAMNVIDVEVCWSAYRLQIQGLWLLVLVLAFFSVAAIEGPDKTTQGIKTYFELTVKGTILHAEEAKAAGSWSS